DMPHGPVVDGDLDRYDRRRKHTSSARRTSNRTGAVMGLLKGAVHVTSSEIALDVVAYRSPDHIAVAIDGAIPGQAGVAAYRKHGEDVFVRLHGPFAIALWDGRTRTLLLARDRAGAKAVHYATAGPRLFFATRTKALLENTEIDRSIDPVA